MLPLRRLAEYDKMSHSAMYLAFETQTRIPVAEPAELILPVQPSKMEKHRPVTASDVRHKVAKSIPIEILGSDM